MIDGHLVSVGASVGVSLAADGAGIEELFRHADLALTMRVTQWLGRPAADFVHPADW